MNDQEKNIQGQHEAKHSNGTVLSNSDFSFQWEYSPWALDSYESQEGLEQYKNPTQHQLFVVRPGILRASSRNGMFAQQGQRNMPDMISGLGPEKLHVNL